MPKKKMLKASWGLLLLGLFAYQAQAEQTRIIITASEPIQYKLYERDNPPCLKIKFLSKNVFARIEDQPFLDQGLIEEVYPVYHRRKIKQAMPALKSLTFYLAREAPYHIIDEDNLLIIAIETPPELVAGPESIEIIQPPALDAQEMVLLKGLIEGEMELKRAERDNE